jgi:methylmalonyl-CoA/ethylmalonyl-CoA epimerase
MTDAQRELGDLVGGVLFGLTGRFRWAQWSLPSGKPEMIAPRDSSDDTSFLVRFLERRGEGFHHITLSVVEIEAALDRATRLGLDIVGLDLGYEPWKEAFVHPRSASGLLIQLAEWTDREASTGRTLHDDLDEGR